tara:strand:+ start:1116 stop:1433 length:318 start_codon:yes stop_codon:yes gene_type:complete
METVKNIKELNVTLDKLYNNDYQINIHFSDKPYTFYVLLKDLRGKIDCKLSSYSANLWTRTKAGLDYRKYKRIQDLQVAIKKEISRKIDTDGEITFSISDVIGYM